MFLESTLFFTKTEKFQKQCCPVLATQSRVIQVACYNCELAGWFWRLIREWKVQSREVHRDFHGSAHDSLSSRLSSREKHLKIFSTIVSLSVLVAYPGDLFQSRKTRVLRFKDSFLKKFQFFPQLFVTVHCLPHFSLNWNWHKYSSNSISTSFLLQSSRKR